MAPWVLAGCLVNGWGSKPDSEFRLCVGCFEIISLSWEVLPPAPCSWPPPMPGAKQSQCRSLAAGRMPVVPFMCCCPERRRIKPSPSEQLKLTNTCTATWIHLCCRSSPLCWEEEFNPSQLQPLSQQDQGFREPWVTSKCPVGNSSSVVQRKLQTCGECLALDKWFPECASAAQFKSSA